MMMLSLVLLSLILERITTMSWLCPEGGYIGFSYNAVCNIKLFEVITVFVC